MSAYSASIIITEMDEKQTEAPINVSGKMFPYKECAIGIYNKWILLYENKYMKTNVIYPC